MPEGNSLPAGIAEHGKERRTLSRDDAYRTTGSRPRKGAMALSASVRSTGLNSLSLLLGLILGLAGLLRLISP